MASATAQRIRGELFGPETTLDNLLSRLESISDLRAQELRAGESDQLVSGVSVTPYNIAGLSGELIVGAHAEPPETTILYFHGGGFVSGCCALYRKLASHLAVSCHARVLLAEYRLAPEHPFPASIEDAIAIYNHLLGTGMDPLKLITAGDSAGGGICAALLLAIRDSGGTLPAGAVLISPWTDLTFSGASYRTRATLDPIDRLPVLRRLAELYLAGSDPAHPLASPVFGDLRGLPKILIQVGDHEVMLDDSTRFFERAREKSVEAEIQVWPEMWHVWHMCVPELPEASEAIRCISAFVTDATSE